MYYSLVVAFRYGSTERHRWLVPRCNLGKPSQRRRRWLVSYMDCVKARLRGRFLGRFFSFCRMRLSGWVTKVLIYIALPQMVWYIRKSIHLIACIKRRKIAAKIACVNGPLDIDRFVCNISAVLSTPTWLDFGLYRGVAKRRLPAKCAGRERGNRRLNHRVFLSACIRHFVNTNLLRRRKRRFATSNRLVYNIYKPADNILSYTSVFILYFYTAYAADCFYITDYYYLSSAFLFVLITQTFLGITIVKNSCIFPPSTTTRLIALC